MADVTGKRVKVPVVKEATALGATILAGYGVGIDPSIAEGAASVVKWDRTFEPNPDNAPVYEKLYQTWRKVYKQQFELSEAGVTKGMWRAPGL